MIATMEETPVVAASVPSLESFHRLIYQQANKCWTKLPCPKAYTVEDLYQEGVLVYYLAVEKYRPERSKFITIFTLMLINQFQYILDRSCKRRMVYDCENSRLTGLLDGSETPRKLVDLFYVAPSEDARALALLLIDPPDDLYKDCRSHKQRIAAAFKRLGLSDEHGQELLLELGLCLSVGAVGAD